ncbi:MAG TPA: pyrroline-5-carboxylate reductase [Caulobacteraceae bacterium]|jgi:pyrroline-5-carboxylate reductase|nr:pyrroline-5-carboxylate reductase [Caulobacteraceae bacterium]
MTPILLIGAGRMGGAMLAGWRLAGAFQPSDLMIRDPAPGPQATASGALLNPDAAAMGRARTVVILVKPQIWREAMAEVAPHLAADAVIVSIPAGVASVDVAAALGGRKVARVMPTTAAQIGQGTASVFATDPQAKAAAHALFAPLGTVVDLGDEDQMHAATAVSGSAPAYLYALVEALEAAGVSLGLPPAAARDLARATMSGAAALMAETGADAADLRRQVTSPNGTTEAALKVLQGEHGLGPLLKHAAAAAEQRSRELGKPGA